MSGATTQSSQLTNTIITSSGTTIPATDPLSSFRRSEILEQNFGGGGGLAGADAAGAIPNPLHKYALYNYIISLSVISPGSFNGSAYKSGGSPGPFLAASGGSHGGNVVATAYGKKEFFIDNLKIEHITGFEKSTGNTNAVGVSFKIIEPYSMGLFFIALQQDAMAKGWKNYLEAVLLLTIRFSGHLDPDNVFVDSGITRHYPIKLRLVEMRVTARGCEYDIAGYPANEQAFEKAKITLPTAVSIKGDTVEKMLKTDAEKSLELYLKKIEKEKVDAKLKKEPDIYEIVFPDAPDGTPNPIKSANMGFSLYRGATTPFAKDNFVYENGVYKRGNIEINPKESEFKFAQGTDIINAINQVVFMSEYGRTALQKVSGDGHVLWWRIECDLHYLGDGNLPSNGEKVKKYMYRVVPYKVSTTSFLPPGEKWPGAAAAAGSVAKVYNYIYSGKNVDVIDFDIQFKAGFYTAIASDGNNNTDDKKRKAQESKTEDLNASKMIKEQQRDGPGAAGNDEFSWRSQPSKNTIGNSSIGGGGLEDPATLAAKQFHDAITSGVDMIAADMTILGDPYYLGDSGIGNYHGGAGGGYVNGDQAMNWDSREVHVTVNFKTPVDINLESGEYDFGNLVKSPQFSGLYRVLRVESNFNKGKFTQVLKMIRLRGQNAESGSGQTNIAPVENP